ncbi:MAG: HAMP domain-containing histidine kinase [Flavobacteriales bacterium]|nr:HAMP domain-containing histidine kinase [Flavobacteriales bacterium]
MEQLIDFFRRLGNSDAFMPRWVCGDWSELHGWMYIISDLIIFLAYMAIPITMLVFVRKRWHDVPFKPVFWLYILFIMLCGFTHLIDAIIFYIPVYRLNALVLLLTAVVSMVTVGALIFVLPKALAYKSPAQLSVIVEEQTSELTQRLDELNRLSERISRKKEQLEHFAYITSHNLRSPAANLHSLIELSKTAEDPDDRNIIMEKIEASAEAILNTIDDVSNVVKLSLPQVEATEVRFKRIIDEVLLQNESELSELNYDLDLQLEVESLVYPPDHFRNVIQNLIENAIRYRKPEGQLLISLRTYMLNDRVVFECEDNGIGIDMEKNGERIFKLYKTVNEDSKGRGIGLFLVQNQLESLNGFINLTSELGKGSKFTVHFGELDNNM